ncbi:lipase family protein [Nocardia salmonicida]|uniref:lipase family protein n=1 Tax=Nocardia salmonicida TaxID=53431 RepID=UPI0009FDEE12|nr:lipase family protein [Nocardia salmonicida]
MATACVAAVGVAREVSVYRKRPLLRWAGTIVKTEPMSILATLPTEAGWPVSARRVMYTTQYQDGSPAAVTGTYIEPQGPWQGAGERPTVVIGPGTAGQGDQCAMSVAFSTGLTLTADPSVSLSANQELPSSAVWSALGARVLVADYIGLGTPGIHTFISRIEGGHAILDGARAANALGGVGPETPLALWGYSQGGGATAGAAELHHSYAPELDLKGTWAGGSTADLAAILARIDGALIGGAIGFAINGLLARYPELNAAVDRVTSPAGRAMLETLNNECVGDIIVKHPFLKTSSLTDDGRPLIEHLRDMPEAAPALAGATVTFRTNDLPPIFSGATIPHHFGPELIDGFGPDNAITYLLDRLADKPITGCTFD